MTRNLSAPLERNHRPALACLLLVAAFVVGCDEESGNGSVRGPLPLPNQPGEPRMGLEANLGGRFVQSVRIAGGSWSGIGPGDAVRIALQADGLSEIRQFEIDLELDPFSAFVIEDSSFEPADPFITFLSGIEEVSGSNNKVKSGAAYLTSTEFVSGDANLGTINLVTSPSFNAQSQATIRVVFFSAGPNSQTRDNLHGAGSQHGPDRQPAVSAEARFC